MGIFFDKSEKSSSSTPQSFHLTDEEGEIIPSNSEEDEEESKKNDDNESEYSEEEIEEKSSSKIISYTDSGYDADKESEDGSENKKLRAFFSKSEKSSSLTQLQTPSFHLTDKEYEIIPSNLEEDEEYMLYEEESEENEYSEEEEEIEKSEENITEVIEDDSRFTKTISSINARKNSRSDLNRIIDRENEKDEAFKEENEENKFNKDGEESEESKTFVENFYSNNTSTQDKIIKQKIRSAHKKEKEIINKNRKIKNKFWSSGKEGEKYHQKNTAFDTTIDKTKKVFNGGFYYDPCSRNAVANYSPCAERGPFMRF